MIGEIDQDGNGCISFNEFLYLMTKSVHEDGDIEEEIREAFIEFYKLLGDYNIINMEEYVNINCWRQERNK